MMKAGALAADAHPLERALVETASVEPGTKVSELHDAARRALEAIRVRLTTLGLLVSEQREFVGRAVPIMLALATACLGFVKIAIGQNRHRPVGFLVVLVLGTS
jgi:uncharacterized protein (TIGR04222 family)